MTSDSYFTLTFYARKPKTDKSEYPLYARISVGGQMTEFTIGRSVNPKHWNQKRNVSDGTSRRDKELNKFLEMVRARFCEIHNMLIRENKLVNPAILKAHYLGTMERPKMMCEVFREANEKRKEELDRGDIVKPTYQRWTRCADYLEDFFQLHYNAPDLPIKEVTSGMLDDFEHFLRMKKGCANNAAVRYLRCVKNVLQYALAHKWITHDPFIGKKYQRTYSERQFLTEAELKVIMELDLKELPRLEIVRDTFVFCCFTGLAFCDMKALTYDDIQDDDKGNTWIRKARAKTGEMCIVPMLEVPRQLILKYAEHPVVKEKGVAMPVITNQKMNAYLKEIADLAKIKKHLTTHVARHTFASMSLCNNVSIEVISKMLGHSDIKTTQIYAKMQDQAVYDGMATMRSKFNTLQIV